MEGPDLDPSSAGPLGAALDRLAAVADPYQPVDRLQAVRKRARRAAVVRASTMGVAASVLLAGGVVAGVRLLPGRDTRAVSPVATSTGPTATGGTDPATRSGGPSNGVSGKGASGSGATGAGGSAGGVDAPAPLVVPGPAPAVKNQQLWLNRSYPVHCADVPSPLTFKGGFAQVDTFLLRVAAYDVTAIVRRNTGTTIASAVAVVISCTEQEEQTRRPDALFLYTAEATGQPFVPDSESFAGTVVSSSQDGLWIDRLLDDGRHGLLVQARGHAGPDPGLGAAPDTGVVIRAALEPLKLHTSRFSYPLAADAETVRGGPFLTVEVLPGSGTASEAGSAAWNLRITGMVPRAVSGESARAGALVAPGDALNLLGVLQESRDFPADGAPFLGDVPERTCRAGTGLTPVFVTEPFTGRAAPGMYALAYTARACPPLRATTGTLRVTIR
jgi:hypothetical protein